MFLAAIIYEYTNEDGINWNKVGTYKTFLILSTPMNNLSQFPKHQQRIYLKYR